MSKRKDERIIKIKELEKRIVAMSGTLETMVLECSVPPSDTNDLDAYTVGYRAGVKASQQALWNYFMDVLKTVYGENYGLHIRW